MARRQIPAALFEPPSIEIEGAVVALALGLDIDVFRQLMADRKITVLCERGTGEDNGSLSRELLLRQSARARGG
jgi:hypothetical protein